MRNIILISFFFAGLMPAFSWSSAPAVDVVYGEEQSIVLANGQFFIQPRWQFQAQFSWYHSAAYLLRNPVSDIRGWLYSPPASWSPPRDVAPTPVFPAPGFRSSGSFILSTESDGN